MYPSKLLGGMKVRNCTKWLGPSSHILIYYIEQSREEIYLVTSVRGDWHSQASWEFCSREELASAFEGFHPEVRKVIETGSSNGSQGFASSTDRSSCHRLNIMASRCSVEVWSSAAPTCGAAMSTNLRRPRIPVASSTEMSTGLPSRLLLGCGRMHLGDISAGEL
jgi:hypothetical protein